MTGFEFATSARIIFGVGSISKIPELIPSLGSKALLVCGSGSVPVDEIQEILNKCQIDQSVFRVGREPDTGLIQSGLELAVSSKSDFVIGFGGGSVLDAAKAITALMTNHGDLMDYLEVIGQGKPVAKPAAPMIAIPTTAGTGTEVTRNAVITSPEHRVKVSMRSRLMIPKIAIVDPALTFSLPPSVTASTGMDALTQVMEASVSIRANPMTDAVAREGIKRGARALPRAFDDGGDVQAREDMALTSLFGGIALANGGLGAVHGFAGPIGGMFDAPHGAICASLLPFVMKYNAAVLSTMESMAELHKRYEDIAQWVTGDKNASIDDGVAWIKNLSEKLEIPRLSAFGIETNDFPEITKRAKESSSMKANPVPLDEGLLMAILEEAF